MMPYITDLIAVVLSLTLILKLLTLEYSREDYRPLIKYDIIVSSIAVAIFILQGLSGGAE